MTVAASLYHRYKRFRTLQTDRITALPLVILMPHSACNCRCVMCDIWKGNKNLKQLTENDIRGLLGTLKKLGTQQVLMSGGEAILNPNFFRFCELLQAQGVRISLLTAGLTLERHAPMLVEHVNDIIVSLDGDRERHDHIRGIPGAFDKLREGVNAIKHLDSSFQITARTVIHRLNFRFWQQTVNAAKEAWLDQISFLPADVSSHAFNREIAWNENRQHEIMLSEEELPELKDITEKVIENSPPGFIAEHPEKLRKIHGYYSALYGRQPFPYKKCNAPWVSTVVEADGTVRPCFFHEPIGNIHDQSLENILNGAQGLRFRKELDMNTDTTCKRCVCYLNLSPGTKLN
jgi:Fe-coproporphyrin III synthase